MDSAVFEDPADSREEILAATYRALSEHGYADLTIQRIGEEFDKSVGLLYYHYDTKDELVLATLEFLLAEFEARFTDLEVDEPREHLETLLDRLFGAEEDRTHLETLIELRARVTHDEAYRDHFARSDRVFEEYLADVLAAGVESGDFRECDPEAVATTLVVFVNGLLLRQVTDEGTDALDRARAELEAYLAARVYADPTT